MEFRPDLHPEGLPQVVFIEDVGRYLEGKPVEEAIAELQQHHNMYKNVELQLVQKRQKQLLKLPEIQRTLQAIKMLRSKCGSDDEVTVDFNLSDNILGQACLRNVTAVNLWLGANVMLEYPVEEAEVLLEQNLTMCERNLELNHEQYEYIQDCITTTQVNLARLYNYDVVQRKEKKAAT